MSLNFKNGSFDRTNNSHTDTLSANTTYTGTLIDIKEHIDTVNGARVEFIFNIEGFNRPYSFFRRNYDVTVTRKDTGEQSTFCEADTTLQSIKSAARTNDFDKILTTKISIITNENGFINSFRPLQDQNQNQTQRRLAE